MSINAMFIHHDDELKYRFNEDHPFNQKRLELTYDLLTEIEALLPAQMLQARRATEDELLTIHQPSYIHTVKGLSVDHPKQQWLDKAEIYGFTSEDTPYFKEMHAVTSTIVGGSITAVDTVMSGQSLHALHLGGGLHHALSNRGSGFCVYNDASVAIAYLRQHYHARVLYIDTDVHHGDGVQWSFYTDPQVCTYSIHETGKFLFPGTGFVHERGESDGFGTCYNIPMEPFTEDDSWLDCFQETIQRVTAMFKPDIIVSQHGCDAHAYDPLSHQQCSMRIYKAMPAIIHQLAHQYCEGRWVALGGGGYDIWRVVPRAWSLLWLEMTDHPLLKQLDHDPLLPLPEAWMERWQQKAPVTIPATWLDNLTDWEPMPRRSEISSNNRKMVDVALQYIP
ncbi:acetoin utilization protein AcuC [Paenibacillus selenitireducens]|uniref:Acetoin utilization protein AcuC n=1 Tax=Paenibacillus selenitireducens TaxID=1324314 RepID=A0A1T2XFD6_9BACL|nr:acetoin utilization protein AcuC [Paenibacillus selenitireducens]OPA78545.1 acetoin utilization protein AcuC [Paenibacillus selenitireducens]